jgi:hypothetical protein
VRERLDAMLAENEALPKKDRKPPVRCAADA